MLINVLSICVSCRLLEKKKLGIGLGFKRNGITCINCRRNSFGRVDLNRCKDKL